ncbi:prefoldin subunit beta [Candidatus Pacearchaeota archaeon]|nr:prefoldin subunit beta [Candidatus Pacearchaeota archaeon]
MDAASRQKIQDLQVLEQNLQNLLIQRQNLQADLNETTNALEEVNKTSDTIYKMVGSIMIVVDKKITLDELEEKKKLIELHSNSIAKQESLIESRAKELQQELKELLENKSTSSSK